jgi:Uma2 family endonuclease
MRERALSLPQPRQSGYTLEDWKTWEGAWELINGTAYPTYGTTAAPSLDHQRASGRLFVSIFNALEKIKRRTGAGDCEVFSAPIDLFLGSTVVQPDLVIVCDPTKKTHRGIEGAPDLVAEILSPSTAGKDLTRKRWIYEAAGVPEYLIVDPEERVGVLLRLEQGRYEEAARIEWDAEVALLNGILAVTLG